MTNIKELIKNDISVIKNSLIVSVSNYSVPYTQNTVPPFNDNNNIVELYKKGLSYLGNIELLAKSVYISYDTTFLSNYKYIVKLNGLNIDNNDFEYPFGNSGGFDYVPVGGAYNIPAGSKLEVYAYNANGATTNGIINILAIFDKLDTYNEG